jgi:hypothetical protein
MDFTERERHRSFEAAKQMVADAKKAAEIISSTPDRKRKDTRGRKSKGSVPKVEIAKSLGVSKGTLINAEQHVETATTFPFMKGKQWSQKGGGIRRLFGSPLNGRPLGAALLRKSAAIKCAETSHFSRMRLRQARAFLAALAHPKSKGRSNVQIAQHCGVNESTVRDWRAKTTSGIPKSNGFSQPIPADAYQELRQGRDGRIINTANIGRGSIEQQAGAIELA